MYRVLLERAAEKDIARLSSEIHGVVEVIDSLHFFVAAAMQMQNVML
jgi:hypothetical protein